MSGIKHKHLLPILGFLPLIGLLFLFFYLNWQLTPIISGVISATYLLANIIVRSINKSLKIGYIIEYALISLLFYFIAVMYV